MEKIPEKLPSEFLSRMKELLGDDYQKYIEALQCEPVRGVRVNTNKISVEKFCEKFDYEIEKVPFSTDGFVLKTDDKIGNTLMHITGQIYLQEPSSMLAVCSSEIEKETKPLKVLDLCASPGGKSGQIASRISKDSILFSNEIVSSRANVLFSNIERLGFKNVVVLNEKPENLLVFENFFDYVFVDAPCSGEGMFRKNPETIEEWSIQNVNMCASRQKEILEVAQRLVAPGGKLVYSTCTFAESEDEEIVEWFVQNFDFELKDVSDAVKNSTNPSKAKVKNGEFARKFYPFSGKGEGQFVAVFECKDLQRNCEMHSKKHFKTIEQIGKTYRMLVEKFLKENTNLQKTENIYVVGSNVYFAPSAFETKMQTALDELKFVSIGVKLGSIEKDRFEPNHNMFVSMSEVFETKIELSDEDLKKFMHGEELLFNTNKKGYAVVTKDGFSIGGVKIAGGKLKNLYPKGLRI